MANVTRSLEKLMATQASEITKKVCERRAKGLKYQGTDEFNHIHEMVEIVLEETKNHYNSKRRKPAPPPPEGGISIREAERTYGVAASTLCGWIKRGLIKVAEKRLNFTYLNEKQVAKLTKLHKENPGRGRASITSKLQKN